MMNELHEKVATLREIFINLLVDSIGTSDTKGSCAFACKYMQSCLHKFTEFKATIRGGDGLNDGGYIDSTGRKHGHYWIEAQLNQDHYIVDITADQFNDAEIVIMPMHENKQYFSGNQDTVDRHLSELLISDQQAKKSP